MTHQCTSPVIKKKPTKVKTSVRISNARKLEIREEKLASKSIAEIGHEMVFALTGLSRSKLMSMQSLGLFPKSVRSNALSDFWNADAVRGWCLDRVAPSRW